MNEDSARAVTLVQVVETAQPPPPHWQDADRLWATRVALEERPEAAPAEFIACRGRHAVMRLAARDPAVATCLTRRLWRSQWIAGAALAGLVLGLLADSIGSSQRVNLLAPPLWAVLAWNLVVYLALLGNALARLMRRPTRPGVISRLVQTMMRAGQGWPRAADPPVGGDRVPPSTRFAALWLRRSAPLGAARAACMLHVAAAALACGLIGGMYLRGLVLDYRAGWESTFLSAPAAHAVLAVALAPASRVSGVDLPALSAFEALRVAHGAGPGAGASAAPWIHLLAWTLALYVGLPRGLLALGADLRARWLARHFPLSLDEPYFQRLARQQRGDVARVRIQPYAWTPGEPAAAWLQHALAPILGDGLHVDLAPDAPFGAEDEASEPIPTGTTHVVVLFDLAATPEPEHHGRFLRALAARTAQGVPTVVMVDETSFSRRFGRDSTRLVQRRDAWRQFTAALGSVPVYIDVDAPDPGATGPAIQLALRNPVTPS